MRLANNPYMHVLSLLVAATLVVQPQRTLVAAPPTITVADTQLVATDVKLDEQNVLKGTVMQTGGKPAANKTVVLGREGKPIGRAIADAEGRFQFANVKPGVYQLATTETAELVQVHPAAAAVPNAVNHVIMGGEATTARGQGFNRQMLLHPLFVGLVIAAAIAIPIAIANNDDDDAS